MTNDASDFSDNVMMLRINIKIKAVIIMTAKIAKITINMMCMRKTVKVKMMTIINKPIKIVTHTNNNNTNKYILFT